MDYFFQDHRRWMGWFENPNHFAAWLALMTPWLWALTRWSLSLARTKSRWAWLLVITSGLLEAAVLIALAGTYSRGGWVALMAGAVVWVCFVRAWRTRAEGVAMGLRVVIAAAAISCFSATERLDPSGWAQDRSVGNRLELWQGAARMMADRPWTGWGAGQSGWVYCEAYQPVEREELYRTCVNSYLTLGAEHGLWLFMLLVGLAIAPLGGLRRNDRNDPPDRLSGGRTIWVGAATASWLAWAVANGFSTLSEVCGLWPWATPAVVVAFAWLSWRRAAWWLAAGAGGAAMLVGLVVLFRPAPIKVESSGGWWRFSVSEQPGKTPWLLLPDERVLGLVPGREARRLALARTDLVVWLPQAPAPFVDRRRLDETRNPIRGIPIGGGPEWARVWLLGANAAPPGIAAGRIWRLHPLGWPAADELLVAGVVLPQLAGSGEPLAWRRWAEARGVAVRRSGVAGVDIRTRWPEVVDWETETLVKP